MASASLNFLEKMISNPRIGMFNPQTRRSLTPATCLTKEQTQAVVARGYRVLAHHFDVLVLKHFVREALSWVKQ